MKRVYRILLAFMLCALLMTGCTGEEQADRKVIRRIPEGEYGIALITDSGNISDKSFNQAAYSAMRNFAISNNIYFTAKKPEHDDNESREMMVRLAIMEGYNVIVLPGYSFAAAVVNCSFDYPDVKFIALDVSEADILSAAGDGEMPLSRCYNMNNTYLVTYKEEQAGFMAGYAAVMMGYEKLGFVGGMEVPSVQRYGNGFIEGANAAASEKGIEKKVEVRCDYAGTFSPNAQIEAFCGEWYKQGTQVIFSCGGGIYSSVAAAACKYDGKMIGVDVDQAAVIDSYGAGMTITSAMKGLGPSVEDALRSIIIDDSWILKAGTIANLGLVSETDMSLNYVQLSDSTQWSDNFSKEDYQVLVADIMNGKYECR